jgi:hypothetical protein
MGYPTIVTGGAAVSMTNATRPMVRNSVDVKVGVLMDFSPTDSRRNRPVAHNVDPP